MWLVFVFHWLWRRLSCYLRWLAIIFPILSFQSAIVIRRCWITEINGWKHNPGFWNTRQSSTWLSSIYFENLKNVCSLLYSGVTSVNGYLLTLSYTVWMGNSDAIPGAIKKGVKCSFWKYFIENNVIVMWVTKNIE